MNAIITNATRNTGSTLGPAPVQRVAKLLAARGCETIDMPITGGYVAAYEGKLALMIGAEEKTLQRALPVFRAFASTITRDFFWRLAC